MSRFEEDAFNIIAIRLSLGRLGNE